MASGVRNAAHGAFLLGMLVQLFCTGAISLASDDLPSDLDSLTKDLSAARTQSMKELTMLHLRHKVDMDNEVKSILKPARYAFKDEKKEEAGGKSQPPSEKEKPSGPPVCTCSNGQPLQGAECKSSGEHCATCKAGFSTSACNLHCDTYGNPCTTSTACSLRCYATCTCKHGTPSGVGKCPAPGEHCASCLDGFEKTPENKCTKCSVGGCGTANQ